MASLAAASRVRHRTRSTPDLLQTRRRTPLGCTQVYTDLCIVSLPIEDLKFNNRNARRHPEKQLTQLAASIGQYGFNSPVLIDEQNTIVAGTHVS